MTPLAFRIVSLLFAASGFVRGTELKAIKGEIERNSQAIKTARADVEVTLALPMSTLSDRFHFQFKYPGRIRIASLTSPEKYRVSRPDTTYISPAAAKDASSTLMGALRADGNGMLFNFLAGIGDGQSARIDPCGDDLCLAIENALPPELAKTDSSTQAAGKASMSYVYSPREKTVKKVKTLAGSYLSTTTIEYATVAGIKVPKTLNMQNGPTALRMEFGNWALNGKVAENAFK